MSVWSTPDDRCLSLEGRDQRRDVTLYGVASSWCGGVRFGHMLEG
jgi:hypothetical protein